MRHGSFQEISFFSEPYYSSVHPQFTEPRGGRPVGQRNRCQLHTYHTYYTLQSTCSYRYIIFLYDRVPVIHPKSDPPRFADDSSSSSRTTIIRVYICISTVCEVSPLIGKSLPHVMSVQHESIRRGRPVRV